MDANPTMPIHVPLVERAFQLAASGTFRRLRDIGTHLEREGYWDVDEHLNCPLLQQLREVFRGKAGDFSEEGGEHPLEAERANHGVDVQSAMRLIVEAGA